MIELLARLIARIKLDSDHILYALIPLTACAIALVWKSVELTKVYFGLDSFGRVRGSIVDSKIEKNIFGVRSIHGIKYNYHVNGKEYTSDKISPYVFSKSIVEKKVINGDVKLNTGDDVFVWVNYDDPGRGYLDIQSSALELCLAIFSILFVLFLGGLILLI